MSRCSASCCVPFARRRPIRICAGMAKACSMLRMTCRSWRGRRSAPSCRNRRCCPPSTYAAGSLATRAATTSSASTPWTTARSVSASTPKSCTRPACGIFSASTGPSTRSLKPPSWRRARTFCLLIKLKRSSPSSPCWSARPAGNKKRTPSRSCKRTWSAVRRRGRARRVDEIVMLIRVRASSRLHFGLLRLPSADDSPDSRIFGGVGLMVRAPSLRMALPPAPAWSAGGPLADRALDFAKRAADGLASRGSALGPWAVDIECAPAEHTGLGTGTQLALAVSRAVAAASSVPSPSPAALAALVGRGTRSAIGIHGFAQGGFLVDGGKARDTRVAPLIARCDFPEDWRVVLVLPRGRQGLHGAGERDVFAQSAPADSLCPTDVLCRLALLGMLPAVHERELASFGEALYELNRRVGEMFRRWQGGTYAHPETAALVEFIRRQGVPGAGQSSWGPTVYAVTDAERTGVLAERLRERFALSAQEVLITEADNRGAEVEIEPKP